MGEGIVKEGAAVSRVAEWLRVPMALAGVFAQKQCASVLGVVGLVANFNCGGAFTARLACGGRWDGSRLSRGRAYSE